MPDEPTISYSVRDVLDRLERKMDQLLATLSMKADREDVVRLDVRMDAAEVRITDLERARESDAKQAKQRTEHRRWLWPTLAGVVGSVGTLVGVLAALHI